MLRVTNNLLLKAASSPPGTAARAELLLVKKRLDLIPLQEGRHVFRCIIEQGKNGSDHAYQTQKDEAANQDAAPCHGMSGFIVLANGIERHNAIDECAQTDERAEGNTDKTGKRNGNKDAAAEKEESNQPEHKADDGMFVGRWGIGCWK